MLKSQNRDHVEKNEKKKVKHKHTRQISCMLKKRRENKLWCYNKVKSNLIKGNSEKAICTKQEKRIQRDLSKEKTCN